MMMMDVVLLAGAHESDIPATATVQDSGSVLVETDRAEYRFTADGWETRLLHDPA